MRKIPEAIAVAGLGLLAGTTLYALYGPMRLPERFPMHFAADGQPDGWGSPQGLLLFPAVAAGLYVLITVVSRFPQVFNYPVRVTPLNRPRIESITLDMITWIKAELVCLFACVQWITIEVARNPGQKLPPAIMPLFLAVIFGTVAWHMAAILRAAYRTPKR